MDDWTWVIAALFWLGVAVRRWRSRRSDSTRSSTSLEGRYFR